MALEGVISSQVFKVKIVRYVWSNSCLHDAKSLLISVSYLGLKKVEWGRLLWNRYWNKMNKSIKLSRINIEM